jgi:ubiquinone/menaquinone biosynthesis C-methylase UbiE
VGTLASASAIIKVRAETRSEILGSSMNQLPRAEFTDVDRAGDPQAYVRMLESREGQPFHRHYKERALALLDLRPGDSVLDVGCGLGTDALAMADRVGPRSNVVGFDLSMTMLREAQQRSRDKTEHVSFCRGDVHHLPFAATSFDRCRADRTFQHLPDPRQALTEMLRVTKPGGRLLIVEPDHESRLLDSPYPDISRKFFAFRNATLQQPGIAHQLYRLFREFRLVDVEVEPLTQVTTDYEEIRPTTDLLGGIRLAQRHGAVAADEADRWAAALEAAIQQGTFFHSLTYFITTGRKPA